MYPCELARTARLDSPHYDKGMSDVFFEQLGLSMPERHLGVGSGGHGEMTGKIMIAFEEVCLEMRPDLVIVVGDVNSTVAASLVSVKMGIPVAHVEAGIRSALDQRPEVRQALNAIESRKISLAYNRDVVRPQPGQAVTLGANARRPSDWRSSHAA